MRVKKDSGYSCAGTVDSTEVVLGRWTQLSDAVTYSTHEDMLQHFKTLKCLHEQSFVLKGSHSILTSTCPSLVLGLHLCPALKQCFMHRMDDWFSLCELIALVFQAWLIYRRQASRVKTSTSHHDRKWNISALPSQLSFCPKKSVVHWFCDRLVPNAYTNICNFTEIIPFSSKSI
jgi:hypothetical protein